MRNPHTGGQTKVQYTDEGIPFITAKNEHDLFFTQGLVVTEYRLWQMEIYRRVGRGTLSEIFGSIALELDISSRRLQWETVVEENLRNTPQNYLDIGEFYLNGVNAFLAATRQNNSLLPPEFARYDVPAPVDFTLMDIGLFVKVLANGLSSNARDEPRNQAMLDVLGEERFKQFFDVDPAMPYVVPPYYASNYSRASADVPSAKAHVRDASTFIERAELMDRFLEGSSGLKQHESDAWTEQDWEQLHNWIPLSGKDRGEPHLQGALGQFLKHFNPKEMTHASNNWAVSGAHTESGVPMFANDPHLPYSAPIIWIVVGLHVDAPDSKWRHVVGATLVLSPGVGIGRNEKISWGYTMVSSDTQDLFVMKNLPGDRRYHYQGAEHEYKITHTDIHVRGAATYNLTRYWSVYGPTIPDDDGTFYSLRWTALYPTDSSVQAIIDQCQAENSEEYIEAANKWWSLSFNAVWADTAGNIGYLATGAIPHRQPGDSGLIPKPGDGSQDWLGIIPSQSLPNFVNPEEGFVVSANNPTGRPTDEVIGFVGNYSPGFRAQRIIDMLSARITKGEKIDAEYMSSIQGSVVDLLFSYLYPTFQRLVLTDSKSISWQQKLLAWDGNTVIDSQEATIFNEVVSCLWNVTYHELGFGWIDPYRTALVFNNASADGVGDDASCGYWNQTCLAYASQCFSDSVAQHRVHVPEWGSLPHDAFFPHILPIPVNENLFVAVGGSGYTPNAAHNHGVRGPVSSGPSMRFIADMSGQVPTQMILPGGESGDPTSPHYRDQLPYWAQVQTLDVDWSQFAN